MKMSGKREEKFALCRNLCMGSNNQTVNCIRNSTKLKQLSLKFLEADPCICMKKDRKNIILVPTCVDNLIVVSNDQKIVKQLKDSSLKASDMRYDH